LLSKYNNFNLDAGCRGKNKLPYMHSLSIVLKVHELGRSVSKVYGEAGISE